MRNQRSTSLVAAALGAGGLVLSACAGPIWPVSHGQLQEHVSESEARTNERIAAVDQEAKDAIARADAASAAAQHPYAYQVLMTDDSVVFETNSAQLSEEAQNRLSELATKLSQQNKNVYIEIQGHADATGPAGYNQQLAEQRAEAVRKFLADKGVPLPRMTTISYGEEKLKTPETTAAANAENRRVVVVVMG